MNLKRVGISLLLVLWLILMIVPFVSIVLAARGEIVVGGESEGGFRLFLLQEKEHQGLGLELRRSVESQQDCLKSSVFYLLWRGSSADINVSYCQCIDPESGLIDPSLDCVED